MINSGFNLKPENNKFDALGSTGKFKILIEVDQYGDIKNAYPIIK